MPIMPSDHKESETPQDESQDPLWQLLENASHKQPSAFFARDTVREARLQASALSPLSSFFNICFTAKTVSITACLALLALTAILTWPGHDSTNPAHVAEQSTDTRLESSVTNTFNELIIEESLSAAADDPSIYSRDEIVAMIGF